MWSLCASAVQFRLDLGLARRENTAIENGIRKAGKAQPAARGLPHPDYRRYRMLAWINQANHVGTPSQKGVLLRCDGPSHEINCKAKILKVKVLTITRWQPIEFSLGIQPKLKQEPEEMDERFPFTRVRTAYTADPLRIHAASTFDLGVLRPTAYCAVSIEVCGARRGETLTVRRFCPLPTDAPSLFLWTPQCSC